LWKSWCGVLQSCYKRTLRTLCTHERRAQKPFEMKRLSRKTIRTLSNSCCWSTHFFLRPTNCGTNKNKYEVVAPNIRRTVFQRSIFLKNSMLSKSHSRQFRHTKQSLQMSDVITYPLIQENFAFVESDLECMSDRQNFGVLRSL